MRKSIIIIIAFLFVLAGCQLFSKKEGFEITKLSLSQEDEGVSFQIKVHTLDIFEEDIISYGVVIINEKINNIDKITFETKDSYLENEGLEFSFKVDEENYQTDYSLRAYIKYFDGIGDAYYYSDSFVTFNLYELAKKGKSDFAKEIVLAVEKEKIEEVSVNIDFDNDTISTSLDSVEASLSKEGENLKIKINAKKGYYFSSNLKFVVNYITIDQNKYTFDSNVINYTFPKPNPDDYIPVFATFDLNGGMWTKDTLNMMTPDSTLLITSKNDITGDKFTILDNKAIAHKFFYKVFIKGYDNTNVYKVVAFDNATSHITNLDLPSYDYVLAIHDNCLDQEALNVIKNYISNDDDNLYLIFDNDPNNFTTSLTVKFYKEKDVYGLYQKVLLEEEVLPIPYLHEYNFIGWSDGENLYKTFPKYQLKDKIFHITYTAVWKSFSQDDFSELINLILPDELSSDINLPITFGKYTINWSSSHEDILSATGKYKKPYQDTIITLTATLKSEGEVDTEMVFEVFAEGYKELKSGIASSYIYTNYHKVTDELFDTLDIINCAFIAADEYGNLNGTTFLASVKSFIIPKAREYGNWVIMSIAPNPDTKWSKIAANPATVEAFANNIVNVINEYGFDGVDIDWETPTSSEAKRFTALMKVVYEKVKANNPNHLVTSAIGGGMWQPPRYDLSNSHHYIDYINMMTYGMATTPGYYQNALYKAPTRHNTKYGVGSTLTSCSIEESIDIYHTYGIPNHKIIVGVAFYGMMQKYTGGKWIKSDSPGYSVIKRDYLDNSDYTEYYDERAGVPYILKNDGTVFISYDNPRSILAKCEYVLDNGLGGIMYWENGSDLTGDLLAAMKTGLRK
ncbi:MAG TPA: hypothetical protein GXZ48_06160 [Acholeplasmataceae bacterium]|nr:hypothetical protein [Acholeplasmataceae bacterium]